ncbi:MAG TPA: tRNA lysidine(34) synthetase TilS [Gemmatimonadales bacterium]
MAASPDLPLRFATHVADRGLFPEPGKAVIAVSGGPDSTALLHLLVRVAPRLGLEMTVGHVDHGIASRSGEWADRVAALAAELTLPCRLARLGLGPATSETRAREARYAALRSMQHALGARFLVTAHHRDDQIETVLLRVLRGSGPAGLAGIPERGADGLVRPLLVFSRREIHDWLRRDVPAACPVSDPANGDTVHDRSWVRAALRPLLRGRMGDAVDAHVISLADQAAADRAAWSAVVGALGDLEYRPVAGGIEVARASLQRYDKVLSMALLRTLAREAGCPLGASRSARLFDFVTHAESGRTLQLGDAWMTEVVFDRVRIRRMDTTVESERPPATRWGAEAEGMARWGGWCITWHTGAAERVERGGYATWATPGSGVIRSVLPGDRLFPLGGVGRRKVRRLLMEARVPRSERNGYPVVARAGDVWWIPGICRGEAHVPVPGEPAVRIEARPTDRAT